MTVFMKMALANEKLSQAHSRQVLCDTNKSDLQMFPSYFSVQNQDHRKGVRATHKGKTPEVRKRMG